MDGVSWPDFKCPTPIQDVPQLKEQARCGSGHLLGSTSWRGSGISWRSDSCVSSDDEGGVLEEDIDAEDLLAELDNQSE